MEPFVFLAFFAAWIPISLYLDAKKRRERIAIWRQAGRAAGLDHFAEPSSPRSLGLLTAWAGGQKVRFEEYSPAKNQTGTRIVIEGDSGISLRREDFGTTLEKTLGAREIEIGDAAFDGEVYVQGAPEVLRAILDAKTRSAVLHLLRGVVWLGNSPSLFAANVRVSDGDLQTEFRETEALRTELPTVLPGLLEVARALTRPPSIPERVAENTRSEPEARVRVQNVLLLANSYPRHPATRAALALACRDENEEVQIRAALALPNEQGHATLLEIAGRESGDETYASRAIAALGRSLPLDQTLSILHNALRKRRVVVAEACIQSIGHVGELAVVEPLARVLALESGDLAVAATRALRASGQPSAEPALLAALGRDLPELRVAAAQALGRVGSAGAVLPLKEAAARDWLDGALRRAAREAVAEIQARLSGASPGQLSLTDADAGRLSLADEDPRGRVSLTDPGARQ